MGIIQQLFQCLLQADFSDFRLRFTVLVQFQDIQNLIRRINPVLFLNQPCIKTVFYQFFNRFIYHTTPPVINHVQNTFTLFPNPPGGLSLRRKTAPAFCGERRNCKCADIMPALRTLYHNHRCDSRRFVTTPPRMPIRAPAAVPAASKNGR